MIVSEGVTEDTLAVSVCLGTYCLAIGIWITATDVFVDSLVKIVVVLTLIAQRLVDLLVLTRKRKLAIVTHLLTRVHTLILEVLMTDVVCFTLLICSVGNDFRTRL